MGSSTAGVECALNGVLVTVTGTAGGLIDNTAETATFNATTFDATKTELKALSATIEWTGSSQPKHSSGTENSR